MKAKFNSFIDVEIPEIKSLKGFKRKLALCKLRYLYPSYDAVYMIRFCNLCEEKNVLERTRKIIYKHNLVKRYGIYFNLVDSVIGVGLFLPHPCSIIIGNGVKIGKNCTIYQNVTIGAKKRGSAANGEYPIILDNCTIYTGAVVIGPIIVKENTVIGANSVLLDNTEPNSLYVGLPAFRKDLHE